jgi:hypothetical protein
MQAVYGKNKKKTVPLPAECKNNPMARKLIPIVLIALILTCSCQTGVKESSEKTADTALLLVASFDSAAPFFVGQAVWIEGTVMHTCKHGGKRMFLADGNDSVLVEVTAGPSIIKFDETLIGSRINLLGILEEERIDEKYLNEWEAEVLNPVENHEAGLHEGTKGHEDQPKSAKLDQINNLRQQLKASGKDHLSFYSIEAVSFEEMPAVEE